MRPCGQKSFSRRTINYSLFLTVIFVLISGPLDAVSVDLPPYIVHLGIDAQSENSSGRRSSREKFELIISFDQKHQVYRAFYHAPFHKKAQAYSLESHLFKYISKLIPRAEKDRQEEIENDPIFTINNLIHFPGLGFFPQNFSAENANFELRRVNILQAQIEDLISYEDHLAQLESELPSFDQAVPSVK